MATGQWLIRLLSPKDNVVLSQVLRVVLIEMKVSFYGYALSDHELDVMYDTYQYVKPDYWVVCYRNHILGGAGTAPLRNGPDGYCELKKYIYFQMQEEKGWAVN